MDGESAVAVMGVKTEALCEADSKAGAPYNAGGLRRLHNRSHGHKHYKL